MEDKMIDSICRVMDLLTEDYELQPDNMNQKEYEMYCILDEALKLVDWDTYVEQKK